MTIKEAINQYTRYITSREDNPRDLQAHFNAGDAARKQLEDEIAFAMGDVIGEDDGDETKDNLRATQRYTALKLMDRLDQIEFHDAPNPASEPPTKAQASPPRPSLAEGEKS